jgi:metastasis-associated protein MTA
MYQTNKASCILLQLPWKTLKNIIEYYYMWKTTDRYVQQKRVKAVEAESKLKQVYIPN